VILIVVFVHSVPANQEEIFEIVQKFANLIETTVGPSFACLARWTNPAAS
jgi:hypothetical protein